MTLREIGPAAVPVLAEALRDESDAVRREAAFELRTIGSPAVPVLMEALQDECDAVRQLAATMLRALGPEAVVAVPALAEALWDESELVRTAASRALGMMGQEAVPALLEALGARNDAVRQVAAAALVQIGPLAAPALVKALGARNRAVRVGAVWALQTIDYPLAESALRGGLRAQSATVRRAAASILRKKGPASEVLALVESMRTMTIPDRRSALRRFSMGVRRDPELVAALPELVESLWDVREGVRHDASWAIKLIGQEIVPTLARMMRDERKELRRVAAWVCYVLGPTASMAVPGLAEAVGDTHDEVRYAAAAALRKIGRAANLAVPVVQALARALGDPDESIRRVAVEGLEEMGPVPREALPALIRALRDTPSDAISPLIDVLGKIGREAWQAVPALTQVVEAGFAGQGTNADAVVAALRALLRITGAASAGVPAVLADALEDRVAPHLQLALWQGGAAAVDQCWRAVVAEECGSEAIGRLVVAAQHGNNVEERLEAILNLGELGQQATGNGWVQGALLWAAEHDPDNGVHMTALGVLTRLAHLAQQAPGSEVAVGQQPVTG
jgi:HEAT repeat protein